VIMHQFGLELAQIVCSTSATCFPRRCGCPTNVVRTPLAGITVLGTVMTARPGGFIGVILLQISVVGRTLTAHLRLLTPEYQSGSEFLLCFLPASDFAPSAPAKARSA
jgi:hypothetical protein